MRNRRASRWRWPAHRATRRTSRRCCASAWRGSNSPRPSRRSGWRLAASSRCPERRPACFAMRATRAKAGSDCSSASRRASAMRRSGDWRSAPSTARNPLRRRLRLRTAPIARRPCRPGSPRGDRARCGCSKPRVSSGKESSCCWRARSGSNPAGGMAARCGATISSPAWAKRPWCGSSASAREAGSCMASLPELPAYAELHCVSNFTFLRGASHPEELVARAAALGYSALALTDECSLAGVVRAHVAAREHRLKLIVGTELVLDDGLKVVLLATDRDSYGAIASLITAGRRRGSKGGYALSRADFAALGGCEALALFVPPHDAEPARAETTEQARWIAAQFPRRAWIAAELLC